MIAKVRIAPVEQWCRDRQELRDRLIRVVGQPVEIISGSMRPSKTVPICDGNEWRVIEASAVRLGEQIGIDYQGCEVWVCEHMLEMD